MMDVCISKHGSCYISAANGGILMKFGLLIDFDLLEAETSTNTKPEVVFSGRAQELTLCVLITHRTITQYM